MSHEHRALEVHPERPSHGLAGRKSSSFPAAGHPRVGDEHVDLTGVGEEREGSAGLGQVGNGHPVLARKLRGQAPELVALPRGKDELLPRSASAVAIARPRPPVAPVREPSCPYSITRNLPIAYRAGHEALYLLGNVPDASSGRPSVRERVQGLEGGRARPRGEKVHGLGVGPKFLNVMTDGRREVEEISGQREVPVLVLDDGKVIADSKKIAEWAAAQPRTGLEPTRAEPAFSRILTPKTARYVSICLQKSWHFANLPRNLKTGSRVRAKPGGGSGEPNVGANSSYLEGGATPKAPARQLTP